MHAGTMLLCNRCGIHFMRYKKLPGPKKETQQVRAVLDCFLGASDVLSSTDPAPTILSMVHLVLAEYTVHEKNSTVMVMGVGCYQRSVCV